MGLAIAIEPMPTDLSLFGSTCYEALGQYPKLRAGVEGSGFLSLRDRPFWWLSLGSPVCAATFQMSAMAQGWVACAVEACRC